LFPWNICAFLPESFMEENLDNLDIKLDVEYVKLPNLLNLSYKLKYRGPEEFPGISVLCSKQAFFEAGGFDPEIFFGWSAEDIFFCLKSRESTKAV